MAVKKQEAEARMTRQEGIVYRHAENHIDKCVPAQRSFSNQDLAGATDGSSPLHINMKVKENLAAAYREAGWTVQYDEHTFRVS